jgi:hypothetical protein
MERGYIRLWRKIRDCKVLREPGKRYSRYEAWLDLVANKAQGVEKNGLKRGEFEASNRSLAKRWNWSKSAVERFMAELQKGPDPMVVSLGHQAGHLAGHFSICKYELYNQTWDTKRDTPRDTYKEGINKEKEKDTCQPGPADESVLFELYESANHRLPQVQERTPERIRKCRSRINQARRKGCLEQYLSDFRAAVERAQRTPFLCGETGGWRANFDWFVSNHTNVYGVLEGKYDSYLKSERGRKPDTIGQSPDVAPAQGYLCDFCEDAGRIVVVFEQLNGIRGRTVKAAPWSPSREKCLATGSEVAIVYRCACEAGKQFLELELTENIP